MKIYKKIMLLALGLLLVVMVAGMYKFNYLSGQPGYDVDGNQVTTTNTGLSNQRVQCENAGGQWQAVGKLQQPMCIYAYADAGQSCTNSTDCQGDCIVTEIDGSNPQCAANNNPFGCKSSIEDFAQNGGILCVD